MKIETHNNFASICSHGNLTRKIGDDVNATTPYPESQTTTSSNELTITFSIGRYSL